MTASRDKESLERVLQPYGQEHLLAFWDELDEGAQTRLARQILAIDLEQIDSLFHGQLDQPDWAELSRQAEPPPAVRLAEREMGAVGSLGITKRAAQERGELALASGGVGVLLTAGGQGSRLGFDQPKGLYPIGPVSGASLLEIHIEKVRAMGRRYRRDVPLYLMTSPATHDETVEFLNKNNRFGLDKSDLVVFCQGTMPAVDIESGKLLLADKGDLFLSPDGHGGTVAALANSDALEHMQSRKVEHLYYLQVDNPLAPIGDPELLGYHLLAESELTSVAVAKRDPQDKLGNFAMIDGCMHIIEYSDLPDDVAQLRDENEQLKFWAGSIAVHVFDRRLLERSLGRKDSLLFHVARKKVPHLDCTGERVDPQQPNALKFERFIFDLLPEAKRPIVVEYAEQECFAPLKNAPGAKKDTPEYVQTLMLAQHRHWLAEAGCMQPDEVKVEISPLYAFDGEELTERIEPGQSFKEDTYLAGK